MNKKYYFIRTIFLIILSVSGCFAINPAMTLPVTGKLPAFPGAEGGGMYTTGGRGGKVLIVNSLEDDGSEGTFRWAVNQQGPRYILFDVAGTIFLQSGLTIRKGDLTIAGQTAPGDGICIAGYPVVIHAGNVIIRYMRFRMGDDAGEALGDGADALEGRKQKNVIIDHCSISWSTDECASFYDNENFTMQWCIISESLRLSNHSKGPHGYGGIWGGVNASFHHNLMAHHDSRTPRYGPGTMYLGKERVDVRNNVFYNWSGHGCYGAEGMNINIVNNYYKPGPATGNNVSDRVIAINVKSNPDEWTKIYKKAGTYYITGNYIHGNPTVSADNWLGVVNKTGYPQENLQRTCPIEVEPLQTEQTAREAYRKVLQYAGCSKVRDEIDNRIVNETRTGTATFHGLSPYNGLGGEWKSANHPRKGIIDSHYDLRPENAPEDWSPWPLLNQPETHPIYNSYGIPLEWMEVNCPGASPEELHPSGYSWLEMYLNSLVQNITEKQRK